MLETLLDQYPLVVNRPEIFTIYPISEEIQLDPEVQRIACNLSQDKPWGERKLAAQKLGRTRKKEAVPWLLSVLSTDPF